jgi:hypothetical protein
MNIKLVCSRLCLIFTLTAMTPQVSLGHFELEHKNTTEETNTSKLTQALLNTLYMGYNGMETAISIAFLWQNGKFSPKQSNWEKFGIAWKYIDVLGHGFHASCGLYPSLCEAEMNKPLLYLYNIGGLVGETSIIQHITSKNSLEKFVTALLDLKISGTLPTTTEGIVKVLVTYLSTLDVLGHSMNLYMLSTSEAQSE